MVRKKREAKRLAKEVDEDDYSMQYYREIAFAESKKRVKSDDYDESNAEQMIVEHPIERAMLSIIQQQDLFKDLL
jgi:hypothetical protein